MINENNAAAPPATTRADRDAPPRDAAGGRSRWRQLALLGLLLLVAQIVTITAVSGWQVYWLTDAVGLTDPPDGNSLVFEPPQLDLGDIPLGQSRQARVVVRNVANRTVRLLEAISDCSCVKLDSVPASLPAGQTAELRFRLEAPRVPAQINRLVGLSSREKTGLIWKARIKARAVGDIWSDPPRLDVQLDADGRAVSQVSIGYADDFTVDTVTCDHPDVDVRRVIRRQGMTVAEIVLDSRQNGRATLRACRRGAEHQPLWETPLAWHTRPELVCRPERLVFDHYDAANDRAQLFIVVERAENLSRVTVQPEVPWIRAVDPQRVSATKLRLWVTVDPQRMPARFDTPILRVGLQGSPTVYHVAAVGRR